MILLIDNYDSFVFNLARYFEKLGHATTVVRNDVISVERVQEMAPQAIVLSPGPCTPDQSGCSMEIIAKLHREIPMLGVCLGHQIIGQSFGAKIVRTPLPMHGRTSLLQHDGKGVFKGIANPFMASRYHSLVIEKGTLSDSFVVNAWTEDGIIMGIQHHELPVVGWQFHPESILTENGFPLLANFLSLANLSYSVSSNMTPDLESELQR